MAQELLKRKGIAEALTSKMINGCGFKFNSLMEGEPEAQNHNRLVE